MTHLPLTRWQRLRLQRQLHQTSDARGYQRTLAVLEHSRGQPIVRIAQMLGVTRQSVHNWIGAYQQAHDPNALVDDERPGRPTLWTEELQALLRTLFEQSPDQRGYIAGELDRALVAGRHRAWHRPTAGGRYHPP